MSIVPRAGTPLPARAVGGVAVRLAAILALLWLLTLTGVPDAVDGLLRHRYYQLRGPRGSQQNVILIATDDETVRAWGPPPWRWQRHVQLEQAIARGKPRLVAYVDAQAGLLVYDSRGEQAIDRVSVRAPELLARAGLAPPAGPLMINFLARERLPTLPAARVAAGDIPAAWLEGKILVVGTTAQPYAGTVVTAAGTMAPAQLEAQALLALSDGALWPPLPVWLRWLLPALVAAATLVLVRRRYVLGGVAAALALIVVVLLADYTLFASGVVLLGATPLVLAIVMAAALAQVRERMAIHRRVAAMQRSLRQWPGTSAAQVGEAGWRRIAERAGAGVDCHSSFVAELPHSSWHVQLNLLAAAGTRDVRVVEQRRDVRRAPYRQAQLAHEPTWHDQIMAPELGLKTLLVPLLVGPRLLGFWMLNFPAAETPTGPRLALIMALAGEIAAAMAPGRRGEGGERAGEPGETRLGDDVAALHQTLGRQMAQKQQLQTLCENLPLGVLVGSLAGEIRYLNAAMWRTCVDAGAGAALERGLPELLVQLSGLSRAACQGLLAQLVDGHEALHLAGSDGDATVRHDFVLSWLQRGELLLLCAVPRASRESRREVVPIVGPSASAGELDDHSTTLRMARPDLASAS